MDDPTPPRTPHEHDDAEADIDAEIRDLIAALDAGDRPHG